MSNGFGPLVPGMEPIIYVNERENEVKFSLRSVWTNSENFIAIDVCELADTDDAVSDCLMFPREVAVKIAEAIMLSENESAGTTWLI